MKHLSVYSIVCFGTLTVNRFKPTLELLVMTASLADLIDHLDWLVNEDSY